MSQNLISICVPAYKKTDYIKRLLDSVLKQTFKNVEIIISDDTPDDSVKLIVSSYTDLLDIKYFQNKPAFGSPKNWNNALNKVEGDFYMLLHQDDWLHNENALAIYLETFKQQPQADFVFCKNIAIDESGKSFVLQEIPSLLHQLEKKPNHLVRSDVIGPPSNVMLRKKVDTRYDERLIWLVDVDYYARLLKSGFKPYYIPQHLVSIGLHADQTTVYVNDNSSIILKENILFAQKITDEAFNDIYIYDYYWRLLRNHKVKSKIQILESGVSEDLILPVVHHIISMQRKFSTNLLKFGPLSKLLMLISYCTK
ncbi:chondroitin synthase [mine drainage metagenome]|uniref:Chondroitin synthase n=1 Tax=mine drainage metagenome TaxID=410659 RepID=A0A1J5SBX4_9ZZZZ